MGWGEDKGRQQDKLTRAEQGRILKLQNINIYIYNHMHNWIVHVFVQALVASPLKNPPPRLGLD